MPYERCIAFCLCSWILQFERMPLSWEHLPKKPGAVPFSINGLRTTVIEPTNRYNTSL